MAENSELTWWRRTRLNAVATLVGGGSVSLLIMLLVPTLDGAVMLGMPFGLLAAILIVPVFLLVLIFRSATRQRRINRASGYFED